MSTHLRRAWRKVIGQSGPSDGLEWAQRTADATNWRAFADSPIWREHDAVIMTQFRGRQRYYEVYTYGEDFGHYPKLDDAKAALERIYGPLQWQQITMPKVEVIHYYFGPTTEFTDPLTVYVTRLPRLGKMARVTPKTAMADSLEAVVESLEDTLGQIDNYERTRDLIASGQVGRQFSNQLDVWGYLRDLLPRELPGFDPEWVVVMGSYGRAAGMAAWDGEAKKAVFFIGPDGFNEVVVLHEVAHIIDQYKNGGRGHGPRFNGILSDLYGRYLGLKWAKLAEVIPPGDKWEVGEEVIIDLPEIGQPVRATITRLLWGTDGVMIRPEGTDLEAVVRVRYLEKV